MKLKRLLLTLALIPIGALASNSNAKPSESFPIGQRPSQANEHESKQAEARRYIIAQASSACIDDASNKPKPFHCIPAATKVLSNNDMSTSICEYLTREDYPNLSLLSSQWHTMMIKALNNQARPLLLPAEVELDDYEHKLFSTDPDEPFAKPSVIKQLISLYKRSHHQVQPTRSWLSHKDTTAPQMRSEEHESLKQFADDLRWMIYSQAGLTIALIKISDKNKNIDAQEMRGKYMAVAKEFVEAYARIQNVEYNTEQPVAFSDLYNLLICIQKEGVIKRREAEDPTSAFWSERDAARFMQRLGDETMSPPLKQFYALKACLFWDSYFERTGFFQPMPMNNLAAAAQAYNQAAQVNSSVPKKIQLYGYGFAKYLEFLMSKNPVKLASIVAVPICCWILKTYPAPDHE